LLHLSAVAELRDGLLVRSAEGRRGVLLLLLLLLLTLRRLIDGVASGLRVGDDLLELGCTLERSAGQSLLPAPQRNAPILASSD